MTAVLAQPPKMIDPKSEELEVLMQKSQDRLKKINILTKQIDIISSTKVSAMKDNIVALEEEKIQLKNEFLLFNICIVISPNPNPKNNHKVASIPDVL